ncbi:MAG: hypothetical protein ACRYGF_00255 [Janthinobacterium lividum]
MADYIYLLETRLSPAQQKAIGTLRTIAREHEVTIFLAGGAVRDLTGGGSIRDLDLIIQGDAMRLRQALEQAGAEIHGEHESAQKLFLSLPGGVRVELSSAMSVSYPKPGMPKYEAGNLSDDLRSRDFTANAMAISLNDGSYGLLIDPLNGVADIENRELRLVSNYGFIEDPSRLIRAARLSSRLGWQMEERTRQRYDTAKDEGYITALSAWNRGYELEEIFHEEDPVRILRALEAEQWMQHLLPALDSSKANTAGLGDLAERQGQLQTQCILAQSAALAFPLVTAKLAAGDVSALKALFVRPGFAREIDSSEARTREFSTRFGSKEAATPSAAWRMLHASEPNLVLALSVNGKSSAVQSRLKTFLTDSPSARQRIPYALMQEMRISADLPEYTDLVEKLFFELMDGKLTTQEEMKAFLEPFSPPAPPPPVNLRRARAKKEVRPSRAKGKKAAEPEEDDLPSTVAEQEEEAGIEEGLMEDGSLTGPDRGPEPTPRTPLVGKVAPEAAERTGKARVKKAAMELDDDAAEDSPDPVETSTEASAPSAVKKADKPAVAAKKTASGQQVIVVAAKPALAAKKSVPPTPEPAPARQSPRKSEEAPLKPAARSGGAQKSAPIAQKAEEPAQKPAAPKTTSSEIPVVASPKKDVLPAKQSKASAPATKVDAGSTSGTAAPVKSAAKKATNKQ